MGSVNLLECVRTMPERPKSVVVITTDKVYMNKEWEWGYREYEPLDGFDPYSNSKSCCELAVHSYVNSFFSGEKLAVSTARAGNVIGGGDFAADRIIPDCVRAAYNGRNVEVRNRYSIRPYQHVLEPVFAYLMIAEKQYNDYSYAGYYNIGPDEYDCVSTGKLVGLFCEKWGNDLQWTAAESKGPHEANFLKLDCSKLKKVFGWAPSWNIEKAVEKSVDWYKCYHENMDVDLLTENQIKEFYACLEEKNV